MHFQNIDFDIDIELFGNFDIDIGIDIEKNGENIENLRSEKNTSASLTLSFGIDFSLFSPLSFDFVSWVLGSSFPFFLRLSNLFTILGLIQNNLVYFQITFEMISYRLSFIRIDQAKVVAPILKI